MFAERLRERHLPFVKDVVDLAAKSSYKNLEDVCEWIVILIPDVRTDCRSIDDDVFVRCKKLEQREFLGGEIDCFPTSCRALS